MSCDPPLDVERGIPRAGSSVVDLLKCLVCRDLFRTLLTEPGVDGRLRSRAARFQERLTDKFQWDFEDLEKEEDDEAPVIVHL